MLGCLSMQNCKESFLVLLICTVRIALKKLNYFNFLCFLYLYKNHEQHQMSIVIVNFDKTPSLPNDAAPNEEAFEQNVWLSIIEKLDLKVF